MGKTSQLYGPHYFIPLPKTGQATRLREGQANMGVEGGDAGDGSEGGRVWGWRGE